MNKHLSRLFILVYLGALVFALLIILKPGASIFYHQQTVGEAEVVPDSGYAYRYALGLPGWLFPPEGALLFENGKLLERATPHLVAEVGDGNYAVGGPLDGEYYLYFSPRARLDARSSAAAFTILTPILPFTRPLGIFYLCAWSLGLAGFLAYAFKDPARRRAVLTSPLSVYDSFIGSGFRAIPRWLAASQSTAQIKAAAWKRILSLTILSAYLSVFMEWLFFITKPSFMNLIGPAEKLGVLILSGLAFALLGSGLFLLSMLLDMLLSYLSPRLTAIYTGALIPAGILAALVMMLCDNFTYTLFGIGIVSAGGLWRGVYALGFAILLAYFTRKVSQIARVQTGVKSQARSLGRLSWIAAGLVGLSLLVAGISLGTRNKNLDGGSVSAGSGERAAARPNIILLGGDGLDATSLSVYGYERDTTPVLRQLAPTSLMAENAFTNAGHSAGSVVSILTSKTPFQTHVLFPPDILSGLDAYQHLPRLLRQVGYHTVEIGVPHYVDAYDINLQDGFDLVNGKQAEGSLAHLARRMGFGDSAYFASQVFERVSDRLLHVAFIRRMVNPYSLVTEPGDLPADSARLDELMDVINQTELPFFVHIHLMETHGPLFYPDQRVYSKDASQTGEWMPDFYDDSISQFDRSVGQVLEALVKSGKFEDTILVIYSDHAQQYNVAKRIPLIIHFPGGEYAGRIQTDVQNLDIAPTLLDYLGLPQPEWMNGQSLLQGSPPQERLIFSGGSQLRISDDGGRWIIDQSRIRPPFYQFTALTIVQCDRWYQYDHLTGEWDSNQVPGHTAPCPEDRTLTLQQARDALAEYSTQNGFDGSVLPEPASP